MVLFENLGNGLTWIELLSSGRNVDVGRDVKLPGEALEEVRDMP